MKKLFILSFALTASLLFVQCKKSEILTEEVISTEKSLTTDVLNGTSWEILSIDSEPNALSLSWDIKYPKFSFNNGIVDMKLGQDLCSKEYLNTDNKLEITTTSTCSISNPNHIDLYNLFDGEFEIKYSLHNSDEIFFKSANGTVLKLRKVTGLSTTAASGLSID
jgi:hypothetical protein